MAVSGPPEDGAFIYGLFIEGARSDARPRPPPTAAAAANLALARSLSLAPTAYTHAPPCPPRHARWDAEAHRLAESRPKELFTDLPIVHLQPIANRVAPTEGFYECPVYKTMARFGVLSTTGHSTNFVMAIEIPSDKPQAHWIKRGTAGLTGLNF